MELNYLENAVIVAHSMGCLIAQFVSVEYPERVKGLIHC